jgi:protoporphyrinogen oxidase
LQIAGLRPPEGLFRSNKVLVFNLGFDRKGWTQPHWVYFPESKYRFYRIGFYDNIFGTDRMSLYIEIGAPTSERFDIEAERARVLDDLREAGVVDGQQLVSHHHVVLDPAYVHISQRSRAAVERYREILAARGIYSLGRYGGWTYCSIEDNILEARARAEVLNAASQV